MTMPPFDPQVRRPNLPPTDVSYAVEDTAVGRMLLAVTADAVLVVCGFAPDRAAEDRWLLRLSTAVSPRILVHPSATDAIRRELVDYLGGHSTAITHPTSLVLATPFQQEVLTGLTGVAYGQRTTYGELAQRVGHPGAARAVGSALGANPLCVVLPCHRVLPVSGGLGGYAGGADAKAALLAVEAGERNRPA